MRAKLQRILSSERVILAITAVVFGLGLSTFYTAELKTIVEVERQYYTEHLMWRWNNILVDGFSISYADDGEDWTVIGFVTVDECNLCWPEGAKSWNLCCEWTGAEPREQPGSNVRRHYKIGVYKNRQEIGQIMAPLRPPGQPLPPGWEDHGKPDKYGKQSEQKSSCEVPHALRF